MANSIIILGAARSGTKILRDCLGAANDVAAIPYDVGYVWRYGNESLEHDELLPSDCSKKISHFINTTLTKFADKNHGSSGYDFILEKSVPNVLRPEFVHAVSPNAKFIHIVRNGYQVVESAMRNWQRRSDRGYYFDKLRYVPLQVYPYMLKELSKRLSVGNHKSSIKTWGPIYDGMQTDADMLPLIDVCIKQWVMCETVCRYQLSQLSADLVYDIKYEDLLKNEEYLLDACEFAGIKDKDSIVRFYRENFNANKTNRSSLSSDEVTKIEFEAGDLLGELGYVY